MAYTDPNTYFLYYKETKLGTVTRCHTGLGGTSGNWQPNECFNEYQAFFDEYYSSENLWEDRDAQLKFIGSLKKKHGDLMRFRHWNLICEEDGNTTSLSMVPFIHSDINSITYKINFHGLEEEE